MTEFERRWAFRPAYDHTDDPNKGWGTMKAYAALVGPGGAITLTIKTGWALPESQTRMKALGFEASDPSIWKGEGAAVGIHHKTDPGHALGDPEPCDYFDGDCYFDISYLAAEDVFERFIREGEDGLWASLAEWYEEQIEQAVPA